MTVLNCTGVLFDCDGVLVDSEASVLSAWTRWALHLRFQPEEVTALVHGRRSAETVALLLPEPRRSEELARINELEIEDAPNVRPIPGARSLLLSMPSQSWAVVTSGRGDLARARLRAAGLPCPSVIVTAEDVVLGKPDPEGYRMAAERLGMAAKDTVVIEDAAIGIQAARAAGASAVVGVGQRAADADVAVADLRSLHWTPAGLAVVEP